MDESIFSHEERTIARLLCDGSTPAEIAAERNQSEATVEAAVDRIEAKTDRALHTIEQSPFLDEAVDDLDDDRRERLRDRLEPLFDAR